MFYTQRRNFFGSPNFTVI